MESNIQMDLDGSPFELAPTTAFHEASQHVKTQVSPKRVLTEIFIDHKPIGLEEEEKISNTPIEKLGKIKFISKPVEDLLRESAHIAASICDAMELECQEIDQLFQNDDLIKAHERVGEISALVEWMLQLMGSLHSYGHATFGEMKISSGNINDASKGMEACLIRLYGSLGQKDYEAFRTELKTEFQTEIQIWKEVFSAVSKHWTPQASKHDS